MEILVYCQSDLISLTRPRQPRKQPGERKGAKCIILSYLIGSDLLCVFPAADIYADPVL